MVRKLTLNMIVLLCIAGFAHSAAVAEETVKGIAVPSEGNVGSPDLVVPEWYFDFGEVKEGTEYLHEFTIRNNGAGILEIRKVTPG